MLAQLHTKCMFHNFFVSSISYRPTDLSLLKEFSKKVSFENFTFLSNFSQQRPLISNFITYYDYSKIVLPQLYTKSICHDFFLCLVFLIDQLTYPF